MSVVELHGLDSSDERVAKVFEEITSRGKTPSNFYRTLAHAPGLLQPWIQLTKAVLSGTSLDRKLAELCILRMALREQAPYVWTHHLPMARAAGATSQQIAALAAWADSDAFSPHEKQVLEYADRVLDAESAGDTHPATALDTQELVELTVLLSFYVATLRIHRMLAIDLETDAAEMPRTEIQRST